MGRRPPESDAGFVAFTPRIPLYISGFGPRAIALAVRHGDGYVLNGAKCFITSGRSAEYAVIFAVNERPSKGVRGWHRTAMRHGVSSLHTGQRFTLGVIFHDAA